MSSLFMRKMVEFISYKRMELFQGMFYKLFEKYNGDWDRFVDDWFEKYSYITLKEYFIEDTFKEDFEDFYKKRKNVLKAYIKAYWSFCMNPQSKPAHIKSSMEFFGLEKLDEKELKKKYREMVKQYHPDTHPDKKFATQKMVEINHHYQILKAFIKKVGG
ncbi:MAG: DnaJ domain-containing protein [Hydrogenothermaceae bacterium]|nr:DnaJ domain-containing protein [Hydrogenothermaceae bacterium]